MSADLSPCRPPSHLDGGWRCLGAPSGPPAQCVAFCLVSGWKFTVSFLQNHLWRENWDPASGEDGGVQLPGVPPWPRGLRDNTHSLQHSSWHSGKGPGKEEPPGSTWNRPSPSSLSPGHCQDVRNRRHECRGLQQVLGSKGGPRLFPEIGKASWRQRCLSWICTWQKVKCINRKNTCVEGQDPLGATGQDREVPAVKTDGGTGSVAR